MRVVTIEKSCRACYEGLMSRGQTWSRILVGVSLGVPCLGAIVSCASSTRPATARTANSSVPSETVPSMSSNEDASLSAKDALRPEALRSTINVEEQELSLHLPEGSSGPLPTVLVLHSAMGRTDSVLDWCDSLAQNGFAAVALDFFDGEIASSLEQAIHLRDAANGRSVEIQARILSTYEAVHQDSRLLAEKRFLLGWSYGAAWATYSPLFLEGLNGVVAYYGQAFTDNPECSTP